jgi:hypothetical protein
MEVLIFIGLKSCPVKQEQLVGNVVTPRGLQNETCEWSLSAPYQTTRSYTPHVNRDRREDVW